MRYLPALLVFGAAGTGYFYTQEGLIKTVSESWLQEESPATASGPVEAERLAYAPKEEMVAVPGPEISNFGEVFRFDLSPRAVTQKWPRVSTGLSDVRFQGYRVPLSTGPAESDLAGSLTYYFDSQPKLRRITFLGTTGNPQRLIQFLARQYGFRRLSSGDARVTTYGVRFPYSGLLKITTAEVMDRNLASNNYRIDLSIVR
jgi:hypothetical protein